MWKHDFLWIHEIDHVLHTLHLLCAMGLTELHLSMKFWALFRPKKGWFYIIFSVCFVVCSLKKITSWTRLTSSRQHISERWISGYLTNGLHLSFASFWKSAQKKVSLSFICFSPTNFHNGIYVSKFPSSEAIRKWQTDFSPGEANVQANRAEERRASGFI